MTSRRMARVARAIQEVVSTSVLFELKDPRISNVTVLRAEVSSDLRHAKVYVSIMGDEKAQSLCMRGLNSARGYLQAKVAQRLQTRYTPLLRFVLDDSVKKSIETSRLIRRVMTESREPPAEDEALPIASDEASDEVPGAAGEEAVGPVAGPPAEGAVAAERSARNADAHPDEAGEPAG